MAQTPPRGGLPESRQSATLADMGDTFIISGLKEKRSAVAGQIVDLRHEIEPDEIPTKGRMPKRSAYFGRNEITRRCYDLLREKGIITANDVSVQAMQDKGLDPNSDRKMWSDFNQADFGVVARSQKGRARGKDWFWPRCQMAADRYWTKLGLEVIVQFEQRMTSAISSAISSTVCVDVLRAKRSAKDGL